MKFLRCRTQWQWGSCFGSPTWITTLFVVYLLCPFGLQCTWWVLIQINHFLYQAVCDSTSPRCLRTLWSLHPRVIELVPDPQAERCSLFSCWDCLHPLIWLTLLQPLFDPSSKLFGSLQCMSTHRVALDPHSCSRLHRHRKCSVLGLCFKTFFKFVFATEYYVSTSLNFAKLHHHFACCARPAIYTMLQRNPHNPLHLLTSTGDTVSKC